MQLQVETYEAETFIPSNEMADLAAEGEIAMMIEEMGLEGQQELYKPNADGVIQVHPYRAMTKEEHRVFSTLFPQTTEVTKYKDGPIPLRCLQIIQHVRSLNHEEFAYIGVMHPDKFVDDPVLFAQKTHYSGTRYILARWGVALAPFETLKEKAIVMLEEIAVLKFQEIQRAAQNQIDNIKLYIRTQMKDGGDCVPSYYP